MGTFLKKVPTPSKNFIIGSRENTVAVFNVVCIKGFCGVKGDFYKKPPLEKRKDKEYEYNICYLNGVR